MNPKKCIVCGADITDRFDLVCKTAACLHEYSHRQALIHMLPAYKEYVYFYSYTLTHILMAEDLPLDELTIY